MRRCIPLIVCGLVGAGITLAQMQVEPVRPGAKRPAPTEAGPQGEQKLRWVCKQLKLDEKQVQTAEALIQVYKAEVEEQKKDPSALLQKIQDKYAELRAAQADNNAELAKKLQTELKEMAPGVQAEGHFFNDLEPALNAEQKEKLPALRKKAETVGDVSMRPIHVLRAARKLGLTADQEKQLETFADEFRKTVLSSKPDSPEANAERVEKLAQDIRGILTAAQADGFGKEIEGLRTGAPPATALAPTMPAPAEPPPPPPPPGQK